MTKDADILIIGGGLNGPALALALHQAGFAPMVIDAQKLTRRKNPRFDGRAYALAISSVRFLRAIGIWDQVTDHAEPIREIKVTDGRAGDGPSPFFMHFDHTEIEEGPMGHMVEDRFLRSALLDALKAAKIPQLSGEMVTDQQITPQGVTLTLASDKTLSGAMVVGADGRSSGTAKRAGIKRSGWGYEQAALVAAVEHAQPHNGIAHQFFMPHGPLAILPLPENRSAIVWSEREETAAEFMALTPAAFLEMLKPRFGDFLGDIKLVGQRYSYPLGLSLADQLIAPRLALVGDAAHGVHPVAGQGLNAGFRDIAALVQVLREARRRGEDYTSKAVLARYQEWRRFDIAMLAASTDASNRLFSNDVPLLRAARDLGMEAIRHTPGLRRAFMREAAGLTGDLPELMRG